MKVAVCSSGATLDSPVDPRFGRCSHFVVVDTKTFEAHAAANPGITSAQGAGIQAAQVVASLGVSAVIAANFGPNAFQALAAAGIRVYTGAHGTVRDAVNQFNSGELQELTAASVPAHFGMGAGHGRGMRRGGGMGRGGR